MKKVNGINYSEPEVYLLQDSGIGVSEIAARTCYDSFDKSENEEIKCFPDVIDSKDYDTIANILDEVNNINTSNLLNSLAWVHHHHSILEHTTLSFLVKGTSRGVLQEHARHRMQNISVRSTRYTMSSVINAYRASLTNKTWRQEWFVDKMLELNILVITSTEHCKLEYRSMWDKLNYQYNVLGAQEFDILAIAKSSLVFLENPFNADELFKELEAGKKKRNIGDAFKHIVTDNWKVDMVITFNIRSLKNYFNLRASGSAWFQIQWLAQAMKEVTPTKYLKLIDKKYKD